MINPLNTHYSFTNPASIYDEEALTALELAGRQAAKINEVVSDQNNLRTETEEHLNQQDDIIEYVRTVTVPEDVNEEVQKQINNGTFDNQIEKHIGNLEDRVDNLLGSVTQGSTTLDAEVIDLRTDVLGGTHTSAGKSVRTQLEKKLNRDNLFTQAYCNSGEQIQNIEVVGTEIHFRISFLTIRCEHNQSYTWQSVLDMVGEEYVVVDSTGKNAVRIPSSYCLVYNHGEGSRVQVILKTDRNPLYHISLLDNVGGIAIGGLLLPLVHSYYDNVNKNNLNTLAQKPKQQIYLSEGSNFSTLEVDSERNLWVAWYPQIILRVLLNYTHHINDVLTSVGEYAGISPKGLNAIRIPHCYTLIFSANDANRYQVIPREKIDVTKHVSLLENLGGKVIGGFLRHEALYYQLQQVDNKIEHVSIDNNFCTEIRDLQNENTLSFVWCSDTHFQRNDGANYGVTRDFLKMLPQLADNVKADFLTITGDLLNGYYPLTNQKKNLVELVNLVSTGKTPYLLTMGNHDNNAWYASGQASSSEIHGLKEVLTSEQFHTYTLNRNESQVVYDVNNPLSGWYYKDFDRVKIRVVALNTGDLPLIENADKSLKYNPMHAFGYSQNQLDWLANTALKFNDDGWGVVIIRHNNDTTAYNSDFLTQILNAYTNKTNGELRKTDTDFEVNIDYDFTQNGSNELIASFGGHVHTDSVTVAKVPQVTIINAHNETGGGCDVVTIDRNARTIDMKRYNSSHLTDYDRMITY